jgi:hypothetical protein
MSMTDDGRFTLRVTARRPSDRQKVACLQPLSKEMFRWENDRPVDFIDDLRPYLRDRICQTIEKTAGCPVEIQRVAVAQEMVVPTVLTQEDYDDDPQWAEQGFKPGDSYDDYILMDLYELDKNILAKPQDSVV